MKRARGEISGFEIRKQTRRDEGFARVNEWKIRTDLTYKNKLRQAIVRVPKEKKSKFLGV